MSQEPFKLDEFITNKYFSCTFSVTNKESFIHELEVNELYFIFNDIKSFAASVKENIEVDIEDIQAKTIRIQFKHKIPS